MTTTVMAMPGTSVGREEADYMMAWRELWLDHIYWTRLAVLAIVDGVPGADRTVERMLRNADDMVGLLVPEYGERALEPLRGLLHDHLSIAAKLVEEAKTGATTAAQTEEAWHRNADDISQFLSTANPYIPYDAVKNMFENHLAMTKQEAVDRIGGDYKHDIETFEGIESMALMMADAISTGVIKQYPEKFGRMQAA